MSQVTSYDWLEIILDNHVTMSMQIDKIFFFFFIVGYVEERLWWPIQSPDIGASTTESHFVLKLL